MGWKVTVERGRRGCERGVERERKRRERSVTTDQRVLHQGQLVSIYTILYMKRNGNLPLCVFDAWRCSHQTIYL